MNPIEKIWYLASECIPEPRTKVKMQWVDGSIMWIGFVENELKELKPEFYHLLKWCYI